MKTRIHKLFFKPGIIHLMALIAILTISFRTSPFGQEFCGIRNTSFKEGEEVSYTVYYALAGIYVPAARAVFTNKIETLNGRPVYHIVGDGRTLPSYEWISKVRDRYESYIDTATMQSLKFVRDVKEGTYKKYENVTFNRSANTAVNSDGVFKVPDCVHDVVSAMYFARNLDFSKYKTGDKIPFSMFIDNETYELYLRYLGKETIRTRFGRFKTIKFKPLLVEGTVFKGGEQMTVWVSDDPNRIPVRVESPIVFGSVKIDMMSYKNLRHPLTSLVKRR
jgi:hypothetical protein